MSEDIVEPTPEETVIDTPPEAKTFTQADMDKAVAQRLAREQRKYEKQLSGIDLDEARQLLSQKEQNEQDKMKERGEFETILKQTVEKKDNEINAYKSKLQQTLVDGAILVCVNLIVFLLNGLLEDSLKLSAFLQLVLLVLLFLA